MSGIEQMARQKGTALRDAVAGELDIESSLGELHAARRRLRRRRQATVAVAAASVAAAVAIVAGLQARQASDDQPEPAPSPRVHCEDQPRVRCTPDGRVVVPGSPTLVLDLPDGFVPTMDVARADGGVDVYQDTSDFDAGVAFIDEVVPVGTRGRHRDAEQLAAWVAARPYLEVRGQRRAEVGGLPAWQVDVQTSKAPPRLDRSCDGFKPRCWPLLRSLRSEAAHESGPWVNMANRYTFVNIGAGRVLAIWSWAYGNQREHVEAADELIRRMEIRTRVSGTPAP